MVTEGAIKEVFGQCYESKEFDFLSLHCGFKGFFPKVLRTQIKEYLKAGAT